MLEAGIRECVLVHHMGHTGERSRGDSRFRDWPDVEWNLVRLKPDDPASPRYMRSYGPDVDVPEAQLVYDPATRALTITAGSRKDATARNALDAVTLASITFWQYPSVPECQGFAGRPRRHHSPWFVHGAHS